MRGDARGPPVPRLPDDTDDTDDTDLPDADGYPEDVAG